MTPEFWERRRVLVTGHTGFKGAWLSIWLHELGAETHGYALEPPTQPSLFEQAGVKKALSSTIADVRDLPRLCGAMESARPEIVFHLAAQSLVLRSYEDPVETYSTNVMGTVHVLEAVRRAGHPCTVVSVTTDKVYENRSAARAYRECDELGGRDPYSSSKAGAELVAKAYRESFFRSGGDAPLVSIATARAGNVIGGGDWTRGQLVPDAVGALLEGRSVALRQPQSVRPWQHVLDCLDGYLTLAERLHEEPERYSGEWNFGPPESDCVAASELVERIAERIGATDAWIADSRSHAHEQPELRLDSSKALELLGWRTKLSLGLALDWTIDWYRAHANGAEASELCRSQIATYTDMRRKG